MTPPIEPEGTQRNTVLRNLLLHLREKETAEIRRSRKDETVDAVIDPRDSLEDAQADETLEIGTEVRFAPEMGERGPQTSSLSFVHPGHQRGAS
jgi:hypothetical protein